MPIYLVFYLIYITIIVWPFDLRSVDLKITNFVVNALQVRGGARHPR